MPVCSRFVGTGRGGFTLGVERTLSDDHRHPLAGVEHVGCSLELIGRSEKSGRRVPDAGARHPVFERGFLHVEVLDIGGKDHDCRSAVGVSYSNGTIHDHLSLHGCGDLAGCR